MNPQAQRVPEGIDEKVDIGRAYWLTERQSGIGGSEAAAILGVSPFDTAVAIWLQKMGKLKPIQQTEPMWWGLEMERLIAKRYTEKTGRRLWDPERAVLRHPEHEFLLGTPDRLVIGEQRGLEIKTANQWVRESWGEPGTDQVPIHYVVQCAHYMEITGFPTWDIAVLFGGNDYHIYTLRRDESFGRAMVKRLADWWEEHIVKGVEPQLDASDSARRYVHERFPEHVSNLIPPPAEAEPIATRLGAIKGTLKVLEVEKDELETRMKALIGDAEGFDADKWKVTWKTPKPSRGVNWERVATEMGQELTQLGYGAFVNERIARCTEERPGTRRFLFKLKEEVKS